MTQARRAHNLFKNWVRTGNHQDGGQSQKLHRPPAELWNSLNLQLAKLTVSKVSGPLQRGVHGYHECFLKILFVLPQASHMFSSTPAGCACHCGHFSRLLDQELEVSRARSSLLIEHVSDMPNVIRLVTNFQD
eukprot:1657421-Amphidinium_carterae.1